ncbi:MAG: DUF1997 domain-containing protein [Chloroflexaceae bacterium]|nr:DUF1997 domain-containing protein [Chloroflexaceae bacterium]
MALQSPFRTINTHSQASSSHDERVMDLGGSATHIFHFDAPAESVYPYFADVPTIFRLLPDTLDVFPYADDRYRLIVGATDGMGHTMSAIFDLQACCSQCQRIRLVPVTDGPVLAKKGLAFRGQLWAEALFSRDEHGTMVKYSLDIEMTIPLPGVLSRIPGNFLQGLGEKGMSLKMSNMINGFTRDIYTDFTRRCDCGCCLS